jgi:hypothetical protein
MNDRDERQERDSKGRLLPGHSVIRLPPDDPRAIAKRLRERREWWRQRGDQRSGQRGGRLSPHRHRTLSPQRMIFIGK